VEELSSFLRLKPCGIFQSPSSTGTFPLRFNSPIQKARWSNQEGAAGTPITTRSFNRDTHAKSLAPWGMKMAFYRNRIPPLYTLNEG
jgi:hypothetical protein